MSSVMWKAIYDDGIELPQYNEDGSENKYTDIDRTKLIKFILFQDNNPKVVIHLDKNKRLIYRRRVAMNFLSEITEVVYFAGWQEKKNGINIQSICFLFEDGHIEIIDGFKEGYPWFYSVVFMPEERL